MIVQGLKLTVLGMGVVFCFLVLLLMLIYISAKLLEQHPSRENPGNKAAGPGAPEEKKRRKIS